MNRVLFFTEAWCKGGIETSLMNVFGRLPEDGLCFDFFSTWDSGGEADVELEVLGIHHVSGCRAGQPTRALESLKGFDSMFSERDYGAVDVSAMSGLGFPNAHTAEKRGVPSRGTHSHNSDVGAKHLSDSYALYRHCWQRFHAEFRRF